MAVKIVLKELGLHFIVVDLGEVEIMEDLSLVQQEQMRVALQNSGLELMDDKRAILIEEIKLTIREMVYSPEVIKEKTYSDFLSEKFSQNYNYLTNLFSEVQGTTIEKFTISHKIERIKELIKYDEKTISEIAWELNYSSVAHLSNQFKKETGLSPSHFKKLKENK